MPDHTTSTSDDGDPLLGEYLLDGVVLEVPPRSVLPNLQESLGQHAPCLDAQNTLWTQMVDEEKELGDTHRALLDTERELAAPASNEDQSDAEATPLSPLEEQAACL